MVLAFHPFEQALDRVLEDTGKLIASRVSYAVVLGSVSPLAPVSPRRSGRQVSSRECRDGGQSRTVLTSYSEIAAQNFMKTGRTIIIPRRS